MESTGVWKEVVPLQPGLWVLSEMEPLEAELRIEALVVWFGFLRGPSQSDFWMKVLFSSDVQDCQPSRHLMPGHENPQAKGSWSRVPLVGPRYQPESEDAWEDFGIHPGREHCFPDRTAAGSLGASGS